MEDVMYKLFAAFSTICCIVIVCAAAMHNFGTLTGFGITAAVILMMPWHPRA
jgi:hypothetical protein